jgi:hypothetical protein
VVLALLAVSFARPVLAQKKLFIGKYVMTFNSWGDKPGKPNQLFYMTSEGRARFSTVP